MINFHRDLPEGVLLQIIQESDAEELFALVDSNRQYLHQWMPWVDATRSVEDILKFIRNAREQSANAIAISVTIRHCSTLVGIASLIEISALNRSAKIGYWLAESHQGKGMMTNACAELIDLAFDELHLHRVEIHCAPENQKSRAIPIRLGFREEGRLRESGWLNGRFVDHVVYGLLTYEWRHSK